MADLRRRKGDILDLDGTLADTLPVCCAAYRQAFAEFGHRSYSGEELAAYFVPDEEGIIRDVLAQRPDQWGTCLELHHAAYARLHTDDLHPFPGIERTLRLLTARAIPTAIVTGKGARSAAISLEHLGLLPYFDLVEVGSPEGPIKPHSIRRVLTRWVARPHHVAYVGDALYDVGAAHEAGILPLGAAWAPTASAAAHSAHGAHTVFADVDQLAAWRLQGISPGPIPPDEFAAE